MIELRPISLTAEGQDGTGAYLYRVSFNEIGTTVDYLFKVEEFAAEQSDLPIGIVSADPAFLKRIGTDPYLHKIEKAVANFHDCYCSFGPKDRAVEQNL